MLCLTEGIFADFVRGMILNGLLERSLFDGGDGRFTFDKPAARLSEGMTMEAENARPLALPQNRKHRLGIDIMKNKLTIFVKSRKWYLI